MSVNTESLSGMTFEYQPQMNIHRETTLGDSLEVIFKQVRREEENRRKDIAHECERYIYELKNRISDRDNEINSLKEVLRLIPDYNRDNRFSYTGEPSPLEQAGKWIKKQLDIPELPVRKEALLQVKGRKKPQRLYEFSSSNLYDVNIPKGYKVVKIVIEKEKE